MFPKQLIQLEALHIKNTGVRFKITVVLLFNKQPLANTQQIYRSRTANKSIKLFNY